MNHRNVTVGTPACVWVLTRPQLHEVVTEMRRADRVAPVVVLTSRRDERHPAFSPAAIRRIIGSTSELYFIRDSHLTHAFEVKMGPRLAVSGGAARIFWARPSGRTAAQHPLIAAPADENDSCALEAFTRQRKASRPLTAEYLDMVERERDEADARAQQLTAALAGQALLLEQNETLLQAARTLAADLSVRRPSGRRVRRRSRDERRRHPASEDD